MCPALKQKHRVCTHTCICVHMDQISRLIARKHCKYTAEKELEKLIIEGSNTGLMSQSYGIRNSIYWR